MKFRKKPVVIDAEQWSKVEKDKLGGNYYLDVGYYRTPDVDGKSMCEQCSYPMHDHGWIDTLEGGHIVCVNDWIITGVRGEKYPCKPHIFEETYDDVEAEIKEGMELQSDTAYLFKKGELKSFLNTMDEEDSEEMIISLLPDRKMDVKVYVKPGEK